MYAAPCFVRYWPPLCGIPPSLPFPGNVMFVLNETCFLQACRIPMDMRQGLLPTSS